ncbi:MAG: hypothetical protein JST35_07480 [Armatimonadetes bacterium]|nr:hypothetical protein [Armatimonadota bacterium]
MPVIVYLAYRFQFLKVAGLQQEPWIKASSATIAFRCAASALSSISIAIYACFFRPRDSGTLGYFVVLLSPVLIFGVVNALVLLASLLYQRWDEMVIILLIALAHSGMGYVLLKHVERNSLFP